MAIKYYDKEIAIEKENHRPFVGYFSPNGSLIAPASSMNGHADGDNSISYLFLDLVSYIVSFSKREDYPEIAEKYFEKNIYPSGEIIKRGIQTFNHDYNDFSYEEFMKFLKDAHSGYIGDIRLDDYARFEYDMLTFFDQVYTNENFFKTLGREISVLREKDWYELHPHLSKLPRSQIDILYKDYVTEALMQNFKDIAIFMLGYDAIERLTPTRKFIDIDDYYAKQSSDGELDIPPRLITSSYPNIYDRYYNYLLMDWQIERVHRFMYDQETGIYEEKDLSFIGDANDKEEMLKEEIDSIKKHVLRKDRREFFRK